MKKCVERKVRKYAENGGILGMLWVQIALWWDDEIRSYFLRSDLCLIVTYIFNLNVLLLFYFFKFYFKKLISIKF